MVSDFTKAKISAVLSYSDKLPYTDEKFTSMIDSIVSQDGFQVEILIINYSSRTIPVNAEVQIIDAQNMSTGKAVNMAFKKATGDYVYLLDNLNAEIELKRSATSAFLLTAERNPGAGYIYTDYEIETSGQIKEIKLLKHHIGRVRDNQDHGRVFFINKSVFTASGGCDESLKFNHFYELRLKLSEQNPVLHLSNRYSGSLYKVVAEGKGHDVFDYLKASKESQVEAENVLSAHLKRIGAYLEPGANFGIRPAAKTKPQLQASVIIPVNNRAAFIGTAIESVLNQTVQDIEVIVMVNGGYNDPTIAKVKEYMKDGKNYDASRPEVRLIVLDINNIGLCLNLGAKAARGEFYVQLDSDDRLKPDAVEKILAVFNSDDKIGMVIGSYEVWQLEDSGQINRVESIPVVTHDEWTENNGRNNLLRINGAGAPRSIPIQLIKDIGYFGINDEPFARNYGEDYEMVLKISEKYRIGRVWEPIYDVVRHSGGTDHSIDQVTIDRNDEAKDYMREEAIKRRQKINSKK